MSGRSRCGVAFGCVAVALGTACGSVSTTSVTPPALVSVGQGLRSHAGLVATTYARGVAKVAALAFDPQGRLWVATAAYTNNGQDGLYVVTSAGATPLEVVSGLDTPLGLLWDAGSLYVSTTGSVDAYSNFNGTRFLSRRTVLTLPANAGESNELVLAPDGKMLMASPRRATTARHRSRSRRRSSRSNRMDRTSRSTPRTFALRSGSSSIPAPTTSS